MRVPQEIICQRPVGSDHRQRVLQRSHEGRAAGRHPVHKRRTEDVAGRQHAARVRPARAIRESRSGSPRATPSESPVHRAPRLRTSDRCPASCERAGGSAHVATHMRRMTGRERRQHDRAARSTPSSARAATPCERMSGRARAHGNVIDRLLRAPSGPLRPPMPRSTRTSRRRPAGWRAAGSAARCPSACPAQPENGMNGSCTMTAMIGRCGARFSFRSSAGSHGAKPHRPYEKRVVLKDHSVGSGELLAAAPCP